MSLPCRTPRLRSLCTAALLMAAAGCERAPSPRETAPTLRADWPSPVSDATPDCAEVLSSRVCWDAASNPVSVAPSPRPARANSPLGLRCVGGGASRTCRDRAFDAPLFTCEGAQCVQRHPRLPDDGEWECGDFSGAVVCRGGEPPAGVAPGARDDGFRCGARTPRPNRAMEHVCVDLSPDFPDGDPSKWSCRFDGASGTTRVCERIAGTHRLGDACDREHPCIDGARCAAARCVPGAPKPACWVAADCDHGACRFGTCTEDAP